ncbi:MAG: TnpV protein [Lachnospiraceae bacterium]|nr:TnpV protein [Lachnospiraceae bacterium]
MSVALNYHRGTDGMLYPNIQMERESTSRLGKYGLMAMEYLRENHPERYLSLQRFGRLTEVLSPVNEQAHRMMDTMMERYMEGHRPNNPADTMEVWQIRRQGMMQAEEIILHDIVNKYH